MKYAHFLIVLVGIQINVIIKSMDGSYRADDYMNDEYTLEQSDEERLGKMPSTAVDMKAFQERMSRIEKLFDDAGSSDNESKKNKKIDNKNKDIYNANQFQELSKIVSLLTQQNKSLVDTVISSNNKIFYYNMIITAGVFIFMYTMVVNKYMNKRANIPVNAVANSSPQE